MWPFQITMKAFSFVKKQKQKISIHINRYSSGILLAMLLCLPVFQQSNLQCHICLDITEIYFETTHLSSLCHWSERASQGNPHAQHFGMGRCRQEMVKGHDLHRICVAEDGSSPHLVARFTYIAGLILGLCPANERWRYFVTSSLIGWAQA